MSEGGRTYRFGPFELDAGNAELRRDGVPVKLAPQPFTVLLTLLDRAGALVTRDELRRVVWGDAHHVDFNAGLNFCLAQIRTALGESTTDPTYIATVPRRGYKFIAPVEVSGVADVAEMHRLRHHAQSVPDAGPDGRPWAQARARWRRWRCGSRPCLLPGRRNRARSPRSRPSSAAHWIWPTRAPTNCARASGSSRRPSATTPSSRARTRRWPRRRSCWRSIAATSRSVPTRWPRPRRSVPWRSTRIFPRRTR